MGFSEKSQLDGKWVIAGIPLRAPLKPIYTTIPIPIPVAVDHKIAAPNDVVETEEPCSTTPTGEEARIPTTFTCPPAPKKRKPSSKFTYRNGGPIEFFTPPDLDTVFVRHAEKAN